MGPRAELVIYVDTSGIFNIIFPVRGVNGVTGGRNIHFIISTTRSTNIVPVGVGGSGISVVYTPNRGYLYNPVNAKFVTLNSGIRLGPVLINKANSSSLGSTRPSFVPSELRTNALGGPKVVTLNSKVSCVGGHGVDGICSCRLFLTRELCSNLSSVPSTILCYPEPSTGRGIPLLSFGVGGVGDRGATTFLTRGSVTIETKCRYSPLTRKFFNALNNKAIELYPSTFGALGRYRVFLGAMGGLWFSLCCSFLLYWGGCVGCVGKYFWV